MLDARCVLCTHLRCMAQKGVTVACFLPDEAGFRHVDMMAHETRYREMASTSMSFPFVMNIESQGGSTTLYLLSRHRLEPDVGWDLAFKRWTNPHNVESRFSEPVLTTALYSQIRRTDSPAILSSDRRWWDARMRRNCRAVRHGP